MVQQFFTLCFQILCTVCVLLSRTKIKMEGEKGGKENQVLRHMWTAKVKDYKTKESSKKKKKKIPYRDCKTK